MLTARFLQSESFYAVAQKKYVFVYDQNGVELQYVHRFLILLALLTLQQTEAAHRPDSPRVPAISLPPCLVGSRRLAKVSRRLDRCHAHPNPHTSRLTDVHGAKPSFRHYPRGPHEWNHDTMVAQSHNTTCQASGPSRSCRRHVS